MHISFMLELVHHENFGSCHLIMNRNSATTVRELDYDYFGGKVLIVDSKMYSNANISSCYRDVEKHPAIISTVTV